MRDKHVRRRDHAYLRVYAAVAKRMLHPLACITVYVEFPQSVVSTRSPCEYVSWYRKEVRGQHPPSVCRRRSCPQMASTTAWTSRTRKTPRLYQHDEQHDESLRQILTQRAPRWHRI